MTEKELNISTHYLNQSMFHVSSTPSRVTTVLGSCVAVCLYDTKNNMGGINHYMFPLWNGEGLATPRYGNIAIEKLYNSLLNLGASPPNIIAKIFGGAKQLNATFEIGERNIQIAKELLSELNIRILAQNTGGSEGRKLIYDTHTGEVQMKFLSNLHKNNHV